MSRVKPYKTRRETLLDNKRMLDFMALASDKPPEEFHTRIPDPPKPRVKSDAISEADVNAEIREWKKKNHNVQLFRNNVGVVELENGARIRYGVGGPGGSDFIGYKTLVISPAMVGQRVAIFVAIESKRPGGKTTEAQEEFLRAVTYDGGTAGVVHSVEELAQILGDTK